jgi:hypothetical protein
VNRRITTLVFFALAILSGCQPVPKREYSNPSTHGSSSVERASQASNTQESARSIHGWMTYQNREFNFRFDYPSNWFVQIQEFGNASDPVHCYSVQITISNFEWQPGQRRFPAADSALISISALERCSSSAEDDFDQSDKNAMLGGAPAFSEIVTEGEFNDLGPVPAEVSGVTFHSFRSGVEYIVDFHPLTTPFTDSFDRVLSSFGFLD